MNVSEKLEKVLAKLEKMEACMTLLAEKEEHMKKLIDLQLEAGEAGKSLAEMKEILERWPETKRRYTQAMNEAKKTQMLMLYLLEHLENNPQQQQQPQRKTIAQTGLPRPVVPADLNENSAQPRSLYVKEYENSPFVLKMKPITLHFIDFEVTLTAKDFARIPAYMKGRETLEQLQSFLDEVLVKAFTDKYTLMHKKREAVKHPADVQVWRMYREQASYFPGRKFITEGDIARLIDRMVDKKMSQKIQMLRHLGVIKEERKESAVCYIWLLEN